MVGVSEVIYVANSWETVREGENDIYITSDTQISAQRRIHIEEEHSNHVTGLCENLVAAADELYISLGFEIREKINDKEIIKHSNVSRVWDYSKLPNKKHYYTAEEVIASINAALHAVKDEYCECVLNTKEGRVEMKGNKEGKVISLLCGEETQLLLQLRASALNSPPVGMEASYRYYTMAPLRDYCNAVIPQKIIIAPGNYSNITTFLYDINNFIGVQFPLIRNMFALSIHAGSGRVQCQQKHAYMKLQFNETAGICQYYRWQYLNQFPSKWRVIRSNHYHSSRWYRQLH